jgi:hypothetical protein
MKRIIFLRGLALPLLAEAQITPIDTDRPNQTESAFLVPKGWRQ